MHYLIIINKLNNKYFFYYLIILKSFMNDFHSEQILQDLGNFEMIHDL